ncbi:hypothetical protein D3C80_1572870 [compost metagenome]
MFEGTLSQGSPWVPILLSYCAVVATNVAGAQKRAEWLLPPVLRTGTAQLFLLLMAPTAFVPALYVGSFDGIVAGLVTFVILPLPWAFITTLLGVRTYLFFHFAVACLCMSLGYLLAVQTWPA